jgi:DNA polymerase III epsilon subunit family exonuclease
VQSDRRDDDEAEQVRRALRLTQAPPPALARRLLGVVAPAGIVPESPLAALRYAVLDFETTGLAPSASEVIEVAVCQLDEGRVQSTFTTLVRPRGAVPEMVRALTGIDDDMVRDSPLLADVLTPLLDRLAGRVLVAHNAAFDLAVLNQALAAHDRGGWAGPVLCTRRLARGLRPDLRRRDLGSLCEVYDIPNRARHRAFGDAEATARLFTELVALAAGQGARTLADLHEASTRRPEPAVDFERYAFGPSFLAHLPESPGIYRMLDRAGDVLYVGKARDLRARVRSYFAGRARGRVAALREALHDIEVFPTDSEIEALLRECAEIRALRPPFNVQVQVFRRAFFLRVSRRAGRARIVSAMKPDGALPFFGPFLVAMGGREAARLLRRAWVTAQRYGFDGADPEPVLARGEGSEGLTRALEAALEESQRGAQDRATADELRRMLGLIRRVVSTAAGPRAGFHRRDLVVRLPSLGKPKIFVLRDGLPLELLGVPEDGDVEPLARRIEEMVALGKPSPQHPAVEERLLDGLKLLDAWLERNPASARIDLGDIAGPEVLRRRLRALLDEEPPRDIALLSV